MKGALSVFVAGLLAGLIAACDTDPYYKTRAYSYGYTPGGYGHGYRSMASVGRDEYYRDYRGIHPPAEASPLR